MTIFLTFPYVWAFYNKYLVFVQFLKIFKKQLQSVYFCKGLTYFSNLCSNSAWVVSSKNTHKWFHYLNSLRLTMQHYHNYITGLFFHVKFLPIKLHYKLFYVKVSKRLKYWFFFFVTAKDFTKNKVSAEITVVVCDSPSLPDSWCW